MRPILLALALDACAPATVDLVQPNAVSKATFQGEWYALDAVVQTPYGTGQTFEGAQGDLERLTWVIQATWVSVQVRPYQRCMSTHWPWAVS